MHCKIIDMDTNKCVGCNRCIRECPLDEVNFIHLEDKTTKVHLDPQKCIHCGSCLKVCYHQSRAYKDDTEAAFQYINSGQKFTVLVAPAFRTNFKDNWPQIIAAFRKMGADGIYDVSFGADICIWAHIRYFENEGIGSVITQPCPVVVDYITKYRHDLMDLLSPIHSPVLCLAQYLRKYKHITNKLIFLSPCVAKSDEFMDTGLDALNLTFKVLKELIDSKNLKLPAEADRFDQMEAGLGRIFSRPGGLMENMAFYLDQRLTIGRIEGSHKVYTYLDGIQNNTRKLLPNILDVLNCEGGCNFGTGCDNENSELAVNCLMDLEKKDSIARYPKGQDGTTELFQSFNRTLRLHDFIRTYHPKDPGKQHEAIFSVDEAFELLDKHAESDRNFNCGACGSATCLEMAIKITKGLNTPENCLWKTKMNLLKNSRSVAEFSDAVTGNVTTITEDIVQVVESLLAKNKDMFTAVQAIQDIVRTTKLLSINATIEAAHAGAAGRSFKVVADEIKRLAENCAKASGEIEKMVSENKELTGSVIGNLETVRQLIGEIQNKVSLLT